MALYFKMSTSFGFCLFYVFAFVNGFLLDSNQGQHTGTNQGYLTVSEFLDEKTKLQDGVNDLRHDIDRKLAIMTNQFQQMISLSQNAGIKNCKNETQDLEQKYQDVLENYTKLADNFKDLKEEYAKQKIELSLLRNKTFENNQEIADLNSLKGVQQLNDFNALGKKVQSIASKTNSLLSNERARNEDFRALYNLSVNSDNRITELNRNCEMKHNLTLNKLQASEVSHNKSLSDKVAELDNKIRVSEYIQNQTIKNKFNELENALNMSLTQVKHGLNLSLTQVRGLIDRNSKRVALTACLSSYTSHPSGYVWKFDDVRTETGIKKLSLFKTSGKFHSEIDGLYLISVWICSNTINSQFHIYRSGNIIARTYITGNGDGVWYTSTAVVAVELAVNDTVWVSPVVSMNANIPQTSCLTIIKIK